MTRAVFRAGTTAPLSRQNHGSAASSFQPPGVTPPGCPARRGRGGGWDSDEALNCSGARWRRNADSESPSAPTGRLPDKGGPALTRLWESPSAGARGLRAGYAGKEDPHRRRLQMLPPRQPAATRLLSSLRRGWAGEC